MSITNNIPTVSVDAVITPATKGKKVKVKVDRADMVDETTDDLIEVPEVAERITIDTTRMSARTLELVTGYKVANDDLFAAYVAAKATYDVNRVRLNFIKFMAEECYVDHAESWVAYRASAGSPIEPREFMFTDIDIAMILGDTSLAFEPVKYVRRAVQKAADALEDNEQPAWANRVIRLAKSFRHLILAQTAAAAPAPETPAAE